MITRPIARFISLSPRLKQTLWTFWYQFLSRRFQRTDWTFMNFGYAPLGARPETLCLQECDEPDRFCIQLYHHLAEGYIGAGARLLEVGSGRGGGCSYLGRYFQETTVVGVDVSESAIAFSAKTHRLPNLTFQQGEAERIPCESNEFDAVINVESSHCYVSMEHFVAEVFRVLKPGGYFLWADLCASEYLSQTHREFEQAGFICVAADEITPNVLRALDLDEPRRKSLITRYVPLFLRGWFLDFAAIHGTRIYEAMRSGETQYRRAILQKPPQ